MDVEKLLAAIEETVRYALAAQDYMGDGPWSVRRARGSGDPYVNGEIAAVCSFVDEASAAHVAHNDPAAVLRRCRADAALVALHRPVVDSGVNSAWPPPGHCAVCWLGDDYEPFPCPTMRTLGLGYGISVEEETTHE